MNYDDFILDDYTDNYGRTFRAEDLLRKSKNMKEFHEKLLREIPYGKFYYTVMNANETEDKFTLFEDLKPYVENYKLKTAVKTMCGPGDYRIRITLKEVDQKEPTGLKKWWKNKQKEK